MIKSFYVPLCFADEVECFECALLGEECINTCVRNGAWAVYLDLDDNGLLREGDPVDWFKEVIKNHENYLEYRVYDREGHTAEERDALKDKARFELHTAIILFHYYSTAY